MINKRVNNKIIYKLFFPFLILFLFFVISFNNAYATPGSGGGSLSTNIPGNNASPATVNVVLPTGGQVVTTPIAGNGLKLTVGYTTTINGSTGAPSVSTIIGTGANGTLTGTTGNATQINLSSPTVSVSTSYGVTGSIAPGTNLISGPYGATGATILDSITVSCSSSASSGGAITQTTPGALPPGSTTLNANVPIGCIKPVITYNFISPSDTQTASPAFSAAISVTPKTQSVIKGVNTVDYTVTVTNSASQYSGQVNLSYDTCPTGAVCSFVGGNSFSNPGQGSSATKTFRIVTSNSTVENSYPFSITATDAGNTGSMSDNAVLYVSSLPCSTNHANFVRYQYSTDGGTTWTDGLPATMNPASTIKVRVVMKNDGCTNWTANTNIGATCSSSPKDNGYYLHSVDDADVWGLNRVALADSGSAGTSGNNVTVNNPTGLSNQQITARYIKFRITVPVDISSGAGGVRGIKFYDANQSMLPLSLSNGLGAVLVKLQNTSTGGTGWQRSFATSMSSPTGVWWAPSPVDASITYDFGAPTTFGNIQYTNVLTGLANPGDPMTFTLEYSNDDVSYTVAKSFVTPPGTYSTPPYAVNSFNTGLVPGLAIPAYKHYEVNTFGNNPGGAGANSGGSQIGEIQVYDQFGNLIPQANYTVTQLAPVGGGGADIGHGPELATDGDPNTTWSSGLGSKDILYDLQYPDQCTNPYDPVNDTTNYDAWTASPQCGSTIQTSNIPGTVPYFQVNFVDATPVSRISFANYSSSLCFSTGFAFGHPTCAPASPMVMNIRGSNDGASWVNIAQGYDTAAVGASVSDLKFYYPTPPPALTPSAQVEFPFTFDITAPTAAGSYPFQWQMHQECVQAFDDKSAAATITVPGGLAPTVSVQVDGQDLATVFQNSRPHYVTWTASNADSCTASSVGGNWSGSKSATGSSGVGDDISADTSTLGTKTYTLSCTKNGVPVSASARMVVIPPPTQCQILGQYGTNKMQGCAWTWDTNYGTMEGYNPIVMKDVLPKLGNKYLTFAQIAQASTGVPNQNDSPPSIYNYWILQNNAPVGPVIPPNTNNADILNFDWNGGPPAGLSTTQNYMMYYLGSFTFNDGGYVFTNYSDDGAALYVDDNLAIDDWSDHASRPASSAVIHLTAGVHYLRYYFYQNMGGSSAKLSWANTGVAPTADIKATSWAEWAGNGRNVPFYYTNSDGPMAVYAGEPFELDWTSSNASICTIDGTSVGTSGSNNTYNANPGSSFNHTYVLSCTGPGGTTNDSITLAVPPMPSNPIVSCPAPGTTATISWTLPGGYNTSYQRLFTPNGSGTSVVYDDTFVGTTMSVPTTAGASYSWWMHTKDTTSGAWSQAIGVDFTCTAPTLKPTILLTPSNFTFSGVSGGAAPAGQTMNIKNTGSATLNWTASQIGGATWCSVATAPTPIAPGSSQNVTINVSAPTTVGSFSDCGIRISDSNATNNPQDASVTYTVKAGPPDGGGGGKISSAAQATCPVTGVVLTWTAGSGASSYNIYRNTHGGAYVLLSGNIGNVLTYTDSTGVAGTYYDYWVESVGGDGTKAPPATNLTTGITPNTCGGPPPATVVMDNPGCGVMNVTWSAVAGATSYNIYHNTTGTVPVIGVTAPSHTNVTSTYADNIPVGSYYFWVTAVSAGGESVPQAPNSGSRLNPTAVLACGIGKLTTSDKDIISFNGSPYSSNQCGGTDALPANTSFKLGDKISFQINLCNSGTGNATQITIKDTLTNLQINTSTNDWNICYNGGVACAGGTVITPGVGVNHYTISGSAPNQVLTINLSGTAVATSGISHLTFDTQIGILPSFTGATSRFQNSFEVDYNDTPTTTAKVNIYTPLYIFSTGKGVPKVIEVP